VTEPATDTASGARTSVAAAVLAGGRASRLGGDKANAVLGGETLATRTVGSLRQAGLDPFIVTKRDRPVEVEGASVVIEPDLPQHPLAGVAAAIREAGGLDVIVLACDLPFIPVAWLGWLAGRDGETVIPCPGGVPQPLAARYRPGNLKTIEAALDRQAPAREAAAELAAAFPGDDELADFGDPEEMFFNVNTAADLRRAEDRLAGD
jgi:molybdopterin-guanine dinucleotide biosynthesis protein A